MLCVLESHLPAQAFQVLDKGPLFLLVSHLKHQIDPLEMEYTHELWKRVINMINKNSNWSTDGIVSDQQLALNSYSLAISDMGGCD